MHLNHVITNSISKNEYFTPRHFLRSCINALPTIIALRKIRSGHPNVIPDVVVPNGISCVVVRYALTILIVIFFYRTSWISVMGRTEVCHWPTWNSKGSANWKKDASLFTSTKMNCRYHLNYVKLNSIIGKIIISYFQILTWNVDPRKHPTLPIFDCSCSFVLHVFLQDFDAPGPLQWRCSIRICGIFILPISY